MRRAANMRKILGARRLRRRRYAYPSIKAEPKYYETYYRGYTPNNSTLASLSCNPSATSLISTPAVGDGAQDRDGKKIVITQVEVKGTVRLAPVTTGTIPDYGTHVFVALILDTQTNTTACSSSDVFTNPGGATTGADQLQPLRNLLFGGRFRVLKMKHFYFNNPAHYGASGSSWQNGFIRGYKFFKKLRMPVNFNAGTTASVANVQDNSLHMMHWVNDATANICDHAYNARIRFVG